MQDTGDIINRNVENIFRLKDTKEVREERMLEKYGEEIMEKIAAIQSEIRLGSSLADACLFANVDTPGFEKLMDEDEDLRRIIKVAQISWKKDIMNKLQKSNTSRDAILLLEKTLGENADSYQDPLSALIQHIQEDSQGSSLVSDRLKKSK